MACTAFSRSILLLGISLFAASAPRASAQSSDKASLAVSSLGSEIGDARAVVLYFIASDCPVSNRTLPEMLRIEREFATRRVRFFFVYPNATETPGAIQSHRIAYGIDHKIRSDPHQTLARLAGANVTPEAAVLIPRGATLKPVYTGRVDDRFLSLGTERPSPTRHDLEDALAAVLTHHPVLPPGGPAVGCAFMTLPAR